MMTIQTIALNKLVPSKDNVRKTGTTDGIAELAASIAAHGLQQNLNVKPTGNDRYEVVAGGRRLRALKQLAKEGLLAKNAGIPCRVIDDGENAAEISLVENALRLAMHPDDQFEAFQQLVDGGLGIEDVAARFGVTPAVVERRLKLAKVSPKLRAAFRKGDLTLEQMMAFAVSDDHAQQEEVHANLSNWRSSPRDIRDALTQQAVALTHPLAVFVTAEAYVAAGGVILRDLFDAGNEGYMPDRMLVLRLADEKLRTAMAAIEAEGWKWVSSEVERDYSVSYGRVYALACADDAGDGAERFDPEDMARAGAMLRVARDGGLTVDRGLVHPDDLPKAPQRATKEPKESGDLPASIIRDLTSHRTAALQAAMMCNTVVALAATVATLARPLFYDAHTLSCLDISLRPTLAAKTVAVEDDCAAHAALAHDAEMWGDRLPNNPDELMDWCVAQPQDVLLELMPYCAARSLNAITDNPEVASSRLAEADWLASHLEVDMAAQWTPSVEGFYGRLNKATMVYIAKEAQAKVAVRLDEVKKDTAARYLKVAMEGNGWLPPVFCKEPPKQVEEAEGVAEAA
ncbi:ParB/RepB/Spo0J family partition protein [Agrobacterium cavarae]|uniref:ParB/RepB/Spo0J family partition protein n=1 Tax=Agrobacterium cavarae TaxID=2528239 RepID=UPI002FDA37CE